MPARFAISRSNALLGALVIALILSPLVVRDVRAAWVDQAHGASGDYRLNIYNPARAIVHARNPYPSPGSDTLRAADAVYPPPVFVVFAPFWFVPFIASASLWTLALIMMALATPVLVGVRDLRCLALWLLSAPVVADVMWGNATLLVAFAAALTWYWRDRPLRAATALGLGSVVKLFIAPLAFWLLIVGRIRTAVWAGLIAVVVTAVAWAGIGFDGLLDYPTILRRLSDYQTGRGLFLSALLADHGVDTTAAIALGAIPAVVLALLAGRYRRDEATAFALTLLAILWVTPVNHVFNLVLLMLALAVTFPRLSLPWLIVPALWLVAFSGPVYRTHHDLLVVFSSTFCLVTTVAIVTRAERTRPRAAPRDVGETVLTAGVA